MDSFLFLLSFSMKEEKRKRRNLRELRFQCIPACILSSITQLRFDADQLIVFRNTVRTCRRACFDLARVERNRKVGDGCVFCFTRAMACDGSPARTLTY